MSMKELLSYEGFKELYGLLKECNQDTGLGVDIIQRKLGETWILKE